MKKVLVLSLFGVVSSWAELSVEQIQEMVMKIHERREGVDLETLSRTKEPFVQLHKDKNTTATKVVIPKRRDVEISLNAIMGDKAFIDGKWMGVGDTIKGYRLVYIGKRGVVFRSGNQIKKVFLHKKETRKIIKIEGVE